MDRRLATSEPADPHAFTAMKAVWDEKPEKPALRAVQG